MAITERPDLVDFDAAAALSAGREVAGDELLTCLEYTHRDSHALYVADRVVEQYRDEEHLHEHFDEVMSYCRIDFSERELFEQLLPPAGDVEYFLTRTDHAVIVRLVTSSQGLLVSLTPDAPVDETIDAIRSVMRDTDEISDSPYGD